MMKKVLHIIFGNKGNLDIDIFNLYQQIPTIENIFLYDENVVRKRNSEDNFDYLKSNKNVFFYTKEKLPELRLNFHFIIVYGINDNQIKLCFKNISQKTILVWKSLGGDIYNPSFINPKEIYKEETYKILKNLNYIDNSIKSKISNYIRRFSLSRKFFRRVNFVSPMLSNEMELVLSDKSFNAKHVFIPLGNVFRLKDSNIQQVSSSASEIFVGASASPSANHTDVFKKINEIGFNNNVHVVMSYKKLEGYQQAIINNGSFYLGSNFKPQLNFLKKKEFNKILDNCHSAIFYNDRQEGLYSIGLCLAKQMKVYLSDTSYTYKYLKEKGYKVFSFQKEFTLQNVLKVQSSYQNNKIKNSIFDIDELKAARRAFEVMSK